MKPSTVEREIYILKNLFITQIRYLILYISFFTRNHITTLDGNWDAQHDTLRSLHLSDNDITEVAPGGGSIEVISQNDNSSQPSSLAAVQTKLETSNSLYPPSPSSGDRTLGGRPFEQLQKLLWLDLSNNRIYHVIGPNRYQ